MPRAMHGAPGTNTDTGDLRASSAIHSHPVADERVDALIRASAENAGVSLGGSGDEGKAVREPRRGWMGDDAFASALERISAGGESWQRCHPHTHTPVLAPIRPLSFFVLECSHACAASIPGASI